MARLSMLPLISRWRRMVDDVEQEIWDDDAAQDILDAHRRDFFALPLLAVPRDGGTFVYSSEYRNLEEYTEDDETVFRLYNSSGTSPDIADFTFDYINGLVTFGADQAGVAYYLDGRAYDLYRAAAQGWEESAGYRADHADIKIGQHSKSKSQIFKQCMEMADMYRRKPRVFRASVVRA